MTKSKQRFRLAELYDSGPKYYHATFDHITHKINSQKKKIPVILLTDIYLVDKNDHKVRMAKSNDFKDSKGRHIIADHIWIKMTKPWFELSTELLCGDQLIFQAEVEKYPIIRDDVLRKRDQIFKDVNEKNEQIRKRWSQYTDTHKRKNYSLSLAKMKEKRRKNIEEAKKKQKFLELVDYSLNKVKKIKVVKKINPSFDYIREIYNYDQYKQQRYKYSAWLAARSMSFEKMIKNN